MILTGLSVMEVADDDLMQIQTKGRIGFQQLRGDMAQPPVAEEKRSEEGESNETREEEGKHGHNDAQAAVERSVSCVLCSISLGACYFYTRVQ